MTDGATLVIEASTYEGSACVVRGATVLAEATVAMRGREQERLMPAVAEVMARAAVSPDALARVVCGAGPGSFTSLRIAGSIAKGIATATGCALVPVSSLALLAGALTPAPAPGRYLLAMDALRGESYVAECELGAGGAVVEMSPVRVVPSEALTGETRPMIGAGRAIPGAPHARGVVRLGALLAGASAVELDTWEPEYGRLAEAQVRWEAAHGRPLPRG